MLYDNVNDANMRLAGSIVRLNGRAIYIRECFYCDDKGYIIADYEECYDGAHSAIRIDDPRLDVSSPPLGYVYLPSAGGMTCGYCVRMPARKQAQGIVPNRLSYLENGNRRPMRANMVTIKLLGKCIEDDYSESEDYYEKVLRGEFSSGCIVPFSREVAVSTKNIYYRAHLVGRIEHTENEHIVTITMPSFAKYNFEEVFNADWRFNR